MSERETTVQESVVRLEVDGRRVAVWTATPLALEALAAGRLLADGFVSSREDVAAIEIDAGADGVYTLLSRLAPGAARRGFAEAEHRREVGCGLLHGLRCDPDVLRPVRQRPAPPDTAAFAGVYRELFAAAEMEGFSSGIHSAALSDGHRLVHQAQEVGRHNAADKAIGGAILSGEDLTGLGLVLSARISGEIAYKAARARLAWVASRSIPTTLAVAIAAAADLPLIARAPGKSPHLFGVRTPDRG